jgi:hypothetical protein
MSRVDGIHLKLFTSQFFSKILQVLALILSIKKTYESFALEQKLLLNFGCTYIRQLNPFHFFNLKCVRNISSQWMTSR